MFACFIVVACGMGVRQELTLGHSPFPFVFGGLVMMGMMYFMFQSYLFDLVDEVWDLGDSLLIKNKGVEDTIALTNIINVNDMTCKNWPRIALMLREPCRFGKEISFSPEGGRRIGKDSPVTLDLICKIDCLRDTQSK